MIKHSKRIFLSVSLFLALWAQGTEKPAYTTRLATSGTQDINKQISHGVAEYDIAALGQAQHYENRIAVLSPQNTMVGGANYRINVCPRLGNSCCIDSLWVDQAYRNNGIGTKILHELAQHAASKQCREITARLYSYQNAKSFFEKNGFTTEATIPSPIAGFNYETYCMTKRLNHVSDANRFADVGNDYKTVGFSLQGPTGDMLHLDQPWNREIQEKIAQGYVIVGYGLLHKTGFSLDLDENGCFSEIDNELAYYNYEQSKIEPESPYTIYSTSATGELVAGAHGCIAVRGNERFCVLDKLWVDQNHRKNKLGTKIMHELIQHAKSKNCQTIRLETRAWQARPFYEKLGFVTVATKPSSYCDGAKDAFMLKKL